MAGEPGASDGGDPTEGDPTVAEQRQAAAAALWEQHTCEVRSANQTDRSTNRLRVNRPMSERIPKSSLQVTCGVPSDAQRS
eukprot:4577046-Pyramimonas_sp.AAC.1